MDLYTDTRLIVLAFFYYTFIPGLYNTSPLLSTYIIILRIMTYMTILFYIPVATLHARFIIIIIIDVTPVYMERMRLYGTSGIYLYDIVTHTQSIEYNTTCLFVCAQRPSASTLRVRLHSSTAIDRAHRTYYIYIGINIIVVFVEVFAIVSSDRLYRLSIYFIV